MEMIKNRIEKNYKKLLPWSQKHQIEAFRVYDRDIPEYPYIIDKYKDFVVLYNRGADIDLEQSKQQHFPDTLAALKLIFQIDENKIIIKQRAKQHSGLDQYSKISEKGERITVRESQAQFYINLFDYLDTGLFLDHRLMRQKIFKSVRDQRFLNLFSYTCSVSVFAALGGAQTTSVDMSATYLDWGKDNFKLNQIPLDQHQFIQENALTWLENNRDLQSFDTIFLDPPTFSNSKKMSDSFDVERDQMHIIEHSMKLLKSKGILYFSNNKRDFKLNPIVTEKYVVRDITKDTIPSDFRDLKIHKVFEIRFKSE